MDNRNFYMDNTDIMADVRDLFTFDIRLYHGMHTVSGSEWNATERERNYEKIYLVAGGRAEVEFHGEGKITLTPGNFYLIPGSFTISFGCEKKIDHYWLHVGLEPALSHVFVPYLPRKIRAEKNLASRFKMAVRKFNEQTLAGQFTARSGVMEVLGIFFQRADVPDREKLLARHRRLKPVLDFMESNLHRNLNVDEIAAEVHLHPSYFTRLFKGETGMPPIRYFLSRKVRHGRYLLATTDMNVAEVAARMGFEDQCYFSRVFSNFEGYPPSRVEKLSELL